MNSTIGRSPTVAAPTPRPEKPASLIGVSMHAPRAELVEHPFGDLVGAVVLRDFLAHEEDVLVALHLLGHGGAEGFSEVDDWHSQRILLGSTYVLEQLDVSYRQRL